MICDYCDGSGNDPNVTNGYINCPDCCGEGGFCDYCYQPCCDDMCEYCSDLENYYDDRMNDD